MVLPMTDMSQLLLAAASVYVGPQDK